MSEFSITYLADHPGFIDVCAAWELSYWRIPNATKPPTFEDCRKLFQNSTDKNALPITLLVINEETNRPVGMGSLWKEDSDYWPEITPWIASLFVHELYRGKGLSEILMTALEDKARTIGLTEIYLTAIELVAPLYKKMRYEVVDTREAKDKPGGVEYLFKKDLNA